MDHNTAAAGGAIDASIAHADLLATAVFDAGAYVRDEEAWEYLSRFSDEHGMGMGAAETWLLAHPDRARPELLRFVGQPHRNLITDDAYRLLGIIGNEADVPAIAAALSAGGRDTYDAAASLARIPGQASFDALLAATASTDADVVGDALGALARRGDEAARPTIEAFLAHPDKRLRISAINALGDLGAEPSRAVLEGRQQVETDTWALKRIALVLSGQP